MTWNAIARKPKRFRVPLYEFRKRGGRRDYLERTGFVASPHSVLETSDEAAALFSECLKEAEAAGREEFWVAFLGDGCRVEGVCRVAAGDESRLKFEVMEIVQRVLLSRCRLFVVAHNHPTGDPRPSVTDWLSTVELVRSMRVARPVAVLECIDHVIVAGDRYASLLELNESVFDG
jgi:DNA repair protein RadC